MNTANLCSYISMYVPRIKALTASGNTSSIHQSTHHLACILSVLGTNYLLSISCVPGNGLVMRTHWQRRTKTGSLPLWCPDPRGIKGDINAREVIVLMSLTVLRDSLTYPMLVNNHR
jgi:hypothetical protein